MKVIVTRGFNRTASTYIPPGTKLELTPAEADLYSAFVEPVKKKRERVDKSPAPAEGSDNGSTE